MVDRGVVACLKRGGIGVMPTDTIYGVVGSALLPRTVERIYRTRRRDRRKPFIVLIASPSAVRKFGVTVSPAATTVLKKLWPGPASVVLSLPAGGRTTNRFRYLHRGTDSIAFRVPGPRALRAFLAKTGPLVAPSANIAGRPPAETVGEAFAYFGDAVDFYLDGGRRHGSPSSVIEVKR